MKYKELPNSIKINNIEYFLERFEGEGGGFKNWVGFIYQKSKNVLPPKFKIQYPNGIFVEYLCSFSHDEDEACDDMLCRINNIIEDNE